MVPNATKTGLDKRKHPRIAVHVPVTYRSAGLTLDTQAINLSQTGAFVTGRSVDPIGTEAEVSLMLGRSSLRIIGVVVWNNGAGMGVRFGGLSRDDRLTLANFLIARFCSG
jgi:hypothetical protein